MRNSFSFRNVLFLIIPVLLAAVGVSQFLGGVTNADGNFSDLKPDGDGVPSAQVASSGSPSPTPEPTHNFVASYFDVENFPTAKLLLNNKDVVPREIHPTLYSLDGIPFQPPSVVVGANSHLLIDLNEWTNLAGEGFRRGSLRLFHTGKDLIIGSQIYLGDEANSLSFEERLTELGRFDSRHLESIWWMPRNQAEVKIILSNTSEEMITVTAKLSKNPHQVGDAQSFTLMPHQTRVLDLRNDFQNGDHFANGRVVGLSLEHTGEKSALKAHGHVKDGPRGYSTIVSFGNPGSAKSSELHGTGLHLGQMGGENLEPVVAVKNVGTHRATVTARVPYTRTDGTTGTVALDAIELRDGEMRLLNMNPVIQRSHQEQIKIAGIEVDYNTAPGTILVSAQSVSEGGGSQVFRVPMADPLAQVSSTGGYPWRTDATSRTVVYIKNMTALEQEYVAYLKWDGSDTEYMIGLKTIAPNKTIEIDVKKLRDEQTPDERGNVIPIDAASGQIGWFLRRKHETGNFKNDERALFGRSEQIDTVNKTSSHYACQSCCNSFATTGFVSPDPFASFPPASNDYEAEVGNTAQFYAYLGESICGGGTHYYRVSAEQWRSSNTSAATVTSTGLVTFVGVADVEIEAEIDGYTTFETEPCGPPGPYRPAEYCELEPADPVKIAKTKKSDDGDLAQRPPCGSCSSFDYDPEPGVDISIKPAVEKIQYQNPAGSDFIDITGTLYVLKGTIVNFKAIPRPANATFPSGKPVWSGSSGATGTGQTKSVTFSTVSSSASNFKTVVATSGNSSVTVNVVVYDLEKVVTPTDNFENRSQTTFGLKETIDLNVTITPSGITATQAGGLAWSISTGGGTIQPGDNGTGTFTAPGSPGNTTLKLTVVSGPSKDKELSHDLTTVAPTASARLILSTGRRHIQNVVGAGFKALIHFDPKNVSFKNIQFSEGACDATTTGYFDGVGVSHPAGSTIPILLCNNATGCRTLNEDTCYLGHPSNPSPTPYSPGTYNWPIPWYYHSGGNPVHYHTANQLLTADASGRATLTKGGASVSYNVSDPTIPW